ncbi:MAG: phage/plasmid primase, P4 family [Aeromicrobium erythreum]
MIETDESRPGQETEAAQTFGGVDSILGEPPRLKAYLDEDEDQLWIWCTHERLWHRHGRGDGHRTAHCRCEHSPYHAVGYELVEVGPLTDEVLAQHRETSWIDGCRPRNCRVRRREVRVARQSPHLLPAPDAPLEVARAVARSYADPTYIEDLAAEDDMLALFDSPNAPAWVPRGAMPYSVSMHGQLPLRFWRGQWMRWQKSHWSELSDDSFKSELYELLGGASFEKTKPDGSKKALPWNPNRRTVSELLAALEAIALIPPEVDAPSWLTLSGSSRMVACANGLLDLSTRQLHDHDPDWFNLVAVPFDYDEHAPPPARWLQFLDQLWPGDPHAIAALQEWFGYVLSGRTDLQKLFLLIGPPRSGKGTIVRILQALVGRGNYTGPTLNSLGTNFGLQPLIGKPLAVVADARLSGRDTHVVVERLLSISGEDTLTIDRKYRDPWSGRLPTRIMVLSNELPYFGDASGAIATRFIVLTLQTSWLGRENIGLEPELKAELPGILSWALDGLERLQVNERFTEAASATDSVLAMHDSASPMSAFIRDRCEVGAGHEVAVRTLFDAWRGWCLDNGRDKPGSLQTFGRSLQAVLPQVKVTRPRDEAGNQVRTYTGVRLSRPESRHISLSAQIAPQLPLGGSQ